MELAIFDFDGTLFRQDTIPFLLKNWKSQGLPRLIRLRATARIYAAWLWHKPAWTRYSNQQFRVDAVNWFTGMFRGMDRKEISEFFAAAGREAAAHLEPAVVEALKQEAFSGKKVVVLSGGFAWLLTGALEGLPVESFVSTELVFGPGDRLLTAPVRVICGPEKITRLLEVYPREQVDWERSSAYADSLGDRDILEAVGQPVAVNPDPDLRMLAREKGWPVLDRGTKESGEPS